MPTLSCTELDLGVDLSAAFDVVGAKYAGDIYMIAYSATLGLLIVNASKKTASLLSDLADPGADLGGRSSLVNYSIKGSKVYARTAHIRTGELVLSDIDVDLSSGDASRVEAAAHSFSWIDAWEEIAESVIIPPYLHVMPDKDTEYIYLIDLDDGSSEQIATGLTGYTLRPSFKLMHYKDDIHMLLGRHFAGDTYRLLSLYSGTVSSLELTTGGGSPRPHIGGLGIFRSGVLIPATSSGVVDADNDIAILDERFNVLVTLDVGSVTGWSSNDLIPGFFIVGRGSDRYYALMPVDNNAAYENTAFRVYWIEFDLASGILDSQLLYEKSVPDEVRTSLFSEYSGWARAPVVDPIAKKIYFIYGVSTTTTFGICEVDVSDKWDDILELNSHAWIVGTGRIPTFMTLGISTL